MKASVYQKSVDQLGRRAVHLRSLPLRASLLIHNTRCRLSFLAMVYRRDGIILSDQDPAAIAGVPAALHAHIYESDRRCSTVLTATAFPYRKGLAFAGLEPVQADTSKLL
jgi:hypothetical protein